MLIIEFTVAKSIINKLLHSFMFHSEADNLSYLLLWSDIKLNISKVSLCRQFLVTNDGLTIVEDFLFNA